MGPSDLKAISNMIAPTLSNLCRFISVVVIVVFVVVVVVVVVAAAAAVVVSCCS